MKISLFRVVLVFYFLTFGAYGFGSDLDSANLFSYLPFMTGLALGVFSLAVNKAHWKTYETVFQPRLRHAGTYLIVFALLVAINLESLTREAIADELSYIRLTNIHAIKILQNLDIFPASYSSGSALQLTSLFFILSFLTPMALLVLKLPIRPAIALAFFGSSSLQVFYSVLGGWGWGYAKVSWLPYLISTSLLGNDILVYRLTSLGIVALGFTAMFYSMRRLEIGTPWRLVVITALVTLPVASYYYSSIDHVIFSLAFVLPALSFLVKPPDSAEVKGLSVWLGLGAVFRLPISFLLGALAITRAGGLKSWLNVRRDLVQIYPAMLLLLPYGMGVLVAPPVFSSSGTVSLDELFDFGLVVSVISEQLGLALLALLLFLVVLGLIGNRLSFGIPIYLSIVFAFYFIILNNAGLVGEPKYKVEWAVCIFALVLMAALYGSGNRKATVAKKLAKIAALLLLLGSTYATFTIVDPPLGPNGPELSGAVGYGQIQRYLNLTNQLRCTPVGVVYGGGNEILAGRPLAVFLAAESGFAQISDTILESSGDWTVVRQEDVESLNLNCLYGSSDAFVALESWKGWEVTFATTLTGVRESGGVVIQRGP